MVRAGFASKIAFLTGGFLIWAAHLLFIYAFNAVACARSFDGTVVLGIGLVPVTVAVATSVAIGLDLLVLAAVAMGWGPGITGEPDPAVRGFWRFGAGLAATLSLVAVTWAGLPAAIIRPCA